MADAEDVAYCQHCGVPGASCTNTCTCPNIAANNKESDKVSDFNKVTASTYPKSDADFH